jgi:azurin
VALLNGIPLLNDSDVRAKAYGLVLPLLTQANSSGSAKGGARYVRISLPRRGTLTLAEVEVFAGGANVALRGTARQSSTANGAVAARAIDGKTHGIFGMNSQTHSAENENEPWWEVDLGSEQPVDAVTVWNRTEDNLWKRLEGFTLSLLDGARQEVAVQKAVPAPERSVRLSVSLDPSEGLRRAAIRALVSMNDHPEELFAAFAGLIARGETVSGAAQGLRQLPRTAWKAAPAAQAATALVRWAGSIPTDGRTGQGYIEALQTAGDLVGLLPAADADSIRAQLKELRVDVFVLRTVREQMRYDTPRLVVEAGKPFEIILENDDFMPHNLVVVKPGARELVGVVSDMMQPTQLDSQGRAFVPANPGILGATRLVEPGQNARLKMVAPQTEGDHEFVCTFPGHWPVMWGQLVVTKDVDAYLKAHPVAPAAGAGHAHEEGK